MIEETARATSTSEIPPGAYDVAADMEPLSVPGDQEVAEQVGRFQRLLSATGRIGHLAARGSQTTLVLLQVSPANEVVRFGAFGAGEAIAHSPVTGALSYGLATLGVEVAGTLAGAPLLDTKPSERITNFLNRKLPKPKTDDNTKQRQYSRTTKLSTAFIGGTVPAMALEKLEDPTRDATHNRRYGLWTSAWLAGACAVQGALMSEGIDLAANNAKLAGGAAGLAGAAAGGSWLKRRITRNRAERRGKTAEATEDVDGENGITYGLVSSEEQLEKAAKLEEKVWHDEDYGSLEEYADQIAHSRTFAAFKDGECIGMARMFGGASEPPPFAELPFYDDQEKAQIIKDSKNGEIEELGTLAVAPEYRGGGMIALHLQRLAYRDARARGVKKWGIIMEPERVEKMKNLYSFTFRQLGPEEDYQGGMCAAHIMDLEEVDSTMKQKLPEAHHWFVDKPLRK